MQNQRNLILAIVLTVLLLIGWDFGLRYFYPQQAAPKPVATASGTAAAPAASTNLKPTREGGLVAPADVALEKRDLQTALAAGNRVPIAAPGLTGSINLVGARIDDLSLPRHREALAKDSSPVRLFSPAGTPAQQYAQFGWVGQGVKLPDANTLWQARGASLTPRTPVDLVWDNGAGQTFVIRFSIDDQYMISSSQSIANRGGSPVSAQPFALLNRTSKTASLDTWNVHSGPVGAFDGSVNFKNNYADVDEGGTVSPAGKVDWLGFTDIYWMSTLLPQPGAQTSADWRALGNSAYRADLIYAPQTIAPGQTVTATTRLFAGAKENQVLERYEDGGISNFSLAIDWGWFRWFEKPIFYLLDALFRTVGNFGVAIILLTLIVRGIMFPIAQRQFASMAAMKALQPKMKALQERHKDDRTKLQQETMALYKQEGVNPLAGCLPIFLQIPVFFALYKVLVLSIEMRHQPFALWIKDLSVPDPLHVLNLFGLLPLTPPSFLAIGPLAILLGITMYLQFRLNPQQMDPAQEQVFKLMPWFMMFVMAPFAAGLLVYWITSNLLTIAQQKWLYSRHPQLRAQSASNTVIEAPATPARVKPAPTRPAPKGKPRRK